MSPIDWLRMYGLWSLLIGTFFEGEGVLLAAGGLAHEGILSIEGVWWIGALGAYLGHLVFFALGRYSKEKDILARLPKWKPKIERALPIVDRHPWLSVFILQYLYGMRIFGAVALGFSGISWRIFLGIQALNCLIWAGLILGLGYELTAQALAWYHAAHRGLWAAGLALSFALVFFFVLKNPLKRQYDK